MKLILCFVCVCVAFCVGEECSNKKTDDDILIESSTSCTLDFQITPGYQMEAEIQELKLDSSDGSYLMLKPEHDENEYKFVWTLKDPKKFIIDQQKVSLSFNTGNTNSNFRVRLKRHGDLTTTIKPTTIETWPSPVDNDTIYHIVNISVSTNIFTQEELTFRQMLVNMTQKYCEQEEILLAEEVTIKNIDIHLALQCDMKWPNYLNCTQITYAIPVFLLNSKKYELTSQHLERMWDIFSKNYLHDVLDWEVYDVPDDAYDMLMWIIASLIVFIIFLIGLFLIRAFSLRFGDRIKRRTSDTEQIIATPKRVSDASLWPTSSQIIPPLFENENSYIYFEPDTTIRKAPVRHHQQIKTNHMIHVDDSSDEEILTVNGNSASTSYSTNIIQLNDAHNRESAL